MLVVVEVGDDPSDGVAPWECRHQVQGHGNLVLPVASVARRGQKDGESFAGMLLPQIDAVWQRPRKYDRVAAITRMCPKTKRRTLGSLLQITTIRTSNDDVISPGTCRWKFQSAQLRKGERHSALFCGNRRKSHANCAKPCTLLGFRIQQRHEFPNRSANKQKTCNCNMPVHMKSHRMKASSAFIIQYDFSAKVWCANALNSQLS